uniref:Uncharacterized protein n=1 Tax=mine drainage metagenome TaxID=410659 RepID=E6PZ27_9ZZZZ
MDGIVDVDKELFDDAGGFGFDFDLSDRGDLAGSYDRAGNVAALHLGELVGVYFCAGSEILQSDARSDNERCDKNADPNPEPSFFSCCRHRGPPGTNGKSN